MAISSLYADNGDLTVDKKPGVSTVHIDNMPEGGGGAVESVNGQTGEVVLTASDVGALPSSTVIPEVDQTYDASSSNAQSGVAVSSAIAAVRQVPSSTSTDADKVLTVDSLGVPGWAAAGSSSDVEYYTLAELDTKFPNGLNDVYTYISGGKYIIIKDGSTMYYLARYSSASDITFMRPPYKPTADTKNEITLGLSTLSFNNNSYTLSYISYLWSSSAYEPQSFANYGHEDLYRPNETFIQDRVYRVTNFSYVRFFVCILGFTADTYNSISSDTTHFKEIRAYDELMLKANTADLAAVATSGSYADLTNVPEDYTLVAGTGITITKDDVNKTITISLT